LQAPIDNPIAALDACAGAVETPRPTREADAALEFPLRSWLVCGGEEQVLTSPLGGERTTRGRSACSPLADGSRRSTDPKWNCSVKNSFLHVDVGYDSDSTDDYSSSDGGSSQRSSSVPSRLDYAEPAGEWHKRCVEESEELVCGHRYTNDLASLYFAWEMPGLLGSRAPEDTLTIAS